MNAFFIPKTTFENTNESVNHRKEREPERETERVPFIDKRAKL